MLTPLEGAVAAAVRSRRDDLAALAAHLVAFDTHPGGAGEEAALQAHVAERMRAAGLAVTTSTWPLKSSVRPPPAPAAVASNCGRPRKSCPAGIG